jgi:uncharacterized protein YqjF (DUF2071 family)
MGQTWKDLLFAHWRVPHDTIRPHVPPQLSVDVFDGDAWIGVTPFELTGLRLVALPPVPGVSTFLEINVRTYVTVGEKPGIFFFSLDAESSLAVQAARRFYRLPYFRARMSAERAGPSRDYSSERLGTTAGEFVFTGRYRATGPVFHARPGSVEYFLAERYCLYTVDDGRLFRGEIHHPPWPLQHAEAEIDVNTMQPPGIPIAGEPLLHFSARQDVVIWSLRPAEQGGY